MPKLSNLVMGLLGADSDRIIGKNHAIASVRAELKMGFEDENVRSLPLKKQSILTLDF